MKLSELENKILLFRGMELSLKIKKTPFSNSRISLKDNCLTVSLSGLVKNEESQCEEAVKKIYAWYKAQARRFFLQEAELERTKQGVFFNDIAIKDTVTRWGSCSAQKNLNFNWRLVMAPPHILKYVVCHEIAHLTQLNHSTEFWNLVETYYPDYKEAKQWLRDNGQKLLSFTI